MVVESTVLLMHSPQLSPQIKWMNVLQSSRQMVQNIIFSHQSLRCVHLTWDGRAADHHAHSLIEASAPPHRGEGSP